MPRLAARTFPRISGNPRGGNGAGGGGGMSRVARNDESVPPRFDARAPGAIAIGIRASTGTDLRAKHLREKAMTGISPPPSHPPSSSPLRRRCHPPSLVRVHLVYASRKRARVLPLSPPSPPPLPRRPTSDSGPARCRGAARSLFLPRCVLAVVAGTPCRLSRLGYRGDSVATARAA
jgi:hypothetical protein